MRSRLTVRVLTNEKKMSRRHLLQYFPHAAIDRMRVNPVNSKTTVLQSVRLDVAV